MKELTFCVQGPIVLDSSGGNLTENLFESIRHFYPGSKIVFSTWEGERVGSKRGIQVIQSKDPGSGLRYRNRVEQNNINRQIISTVSGLNAVTTDYVVKLRSDLLVHGKSLGTILSRIPETINHEYSVFEKYVIVPDRLTFSPRKKLNPALHVTDMLQAGLTSDIKKLWDIPLMSLNQEVFYKYVSPEISKEVSDHLPEFRAEQYFWNEFIYRELGIRLPDTRARRLSNGFEVEDFFNLNIIPFRFPTIDISIQKEIYADWSKNDSWISAIYAHTYRDWKQFARSRGISFRLPLRNSFWEFRGAIYGDFYKKGFDFPPKSKIQRAR
jgi:hypothetical protein